MSANIFRQVSGAGLNLTQVKTYGANVKGWAILNTSAAASFVKLYFYVPGSVTAGVDAPTVGTTPPSITIEIPAGAMEKQSYPDGVSMKGDLWMATTTAAADASTAPVAAGDLITQLFIE